jgi:hypothetical protein
MTGTDDTGGADDVVVDSAAGWEAIDAALHQLYPGVEPRHYGATIPWRLGGSNPLDGISAYPRADHWHFVTYGLSELYEKESRDPTVSGWGFEFTFRLARSDDDAEPPAWALNFLQNLARYVVESGNAFEPGHRMHLNGPICLATPDTAIRTVTFVVDSELDEIDTPHGRLRFLQIVGLTLAEHAAAEQWDVDRLLAIIGRSMPLFVTDIEREDLANDPAIAAAISDGSAREGSSTGSLFVSTVSALTNRGRTTVTFGANAVERIARVLMGRLPFGRGLLVDGPDAAVGFLPGDHLAIDDRGNGLLEIALPPDLLIEFVSVLRPVAGSYDLPGSADLAVQIVKSQIRGVDGTVIAEVG